MMGSAESTARPMGHAGRTWLKNIGRVSGAIGLMLLVSSPLTWLLTAEFGPLVWAKLIIGGMLVAIYMATNGEFFTRIIGARSTGLMVMSGVTMSFVVGLVVAANFAAYRANREFDLTQDQIFTLSPQTTQILKDLGEGVHAYAFYPSFDSGFALTQDSLERYKRAGHRHFTYEMVDPQSRPDLVEKYNITEHGPRIVVTLADAGTRHAEARAKEPSEQELTYAIMRVTGGPAKKVYFLTGHREPDINDGEAPEGYKQLSDAVAAEGYEPIILDFARTFGAAQVNINKDAAPGALSVPDDAGVLIVAGVRRPLQAPEVAAIEDYLARGGRVCALIDPHADSGLENLLRQWKIEAHNDIIIDTNPLNRLLGLGAAAPLIQPSGVAHPVTRELNAPVVMLTARSLQVASGGLADVHAEGLAQTGETAWGETQLGQDGTASRDDQDYPAPLTVAIAATRDTSGAPNKRFDEARLVVFGDSDWASNRYINMQGNKDFVLNTLAWVAESQDKITIRPKARAGSQLFLSGAQLGELKFVSMDILPMLIVAVGLGVVLVRRQR